MPKKIMPRRQFSKIVQEADEIKEVIALPGWKVIADDIRGQMESIKTQLAENRLRTIQETIQTREGTKTYITTAETQIAENAGMYKMGKYIFDLIDKITKAPDQIKEMQKKGIIGVEGEIKEEKPTKE